MDKHAVSADRVVNIDETSCRLLPVHQIGWGRSGVKQPQLQGNTREATTFTVAFSMDRAWPAGLAGADRARWQDRRRLAGAALAGAHSSRHVGERLGHHDDTPAARGHIGRRGQPKQRRTTVDPSLGRGQHPRQGVHPGRREDRFPSRRTVLLPAMKHVVLAALRRGRLPQSATLARSVLDGTFEGLAMNSHRQNGRLAQSRTSATRTRLGQLGGVHCVPAAMPLHAAMCSS